MEHVNIETFKKSIEFFFRSRIPCQIINLVIAYRNPSLLGLLAKIKV